VVVGSRFDDNENGEDAGSVYVYDSSEKAPPGWSKGKKAGWDGSTPPGLDKTPAGYDKGNKKGW